MEHTNLVVDSTVAALLDLQKISTQDERVTLEGTLKMMEVIQECPGHLRARVLDKFEEELQLEA